MIRYAQACILCSDILKRHDILSTKQLSERFINRRLILSSTKVFPMLKSIMSLSYRWRKMVLAIRFWFKWWQLTIVSLLW